MDDDDDDEGFEVALGQTDRQSDRRTWVMSRRQTLLWGVRMHCNSDSLLSAVQNKIALTKGFKGFNVAQMQRSERLRYQDKNRLSFILYLKKRKYIQYKNTFRCR